MSPAVLWWQAFTLFVNLIVFAHYRLRYTEGRYRTATREMLWDVLRYAKGMAISWEKWLIATHVKPESVQAAIPFEESPSHVDHHVAEIASAPSNGTRTE